MDKRTQVGLTVLLVVTSLFLGGVHPSNAIPLQTVSPSAMTTVSGWVYDAGIEGGESHGYPLYASLTFTAPDFEQIIYTSPFDGSYQIELSSGRNYSVTVSAVSQGYISKTDVIVVGSNPIARDFHLFIDAASCSAPGYSGGAFFEDFESGALPFGWNTVDYAGTGEVWAFYKNGGLGNLTPGTGGFAVLDSDGYGDLGYQDAGLRTPVLNLSKASIVTLDFDTDFLSWFATADVRVSGNNGTSWVTVSRWTEDLESTHISLDISTPAAGKSQVIVEFRYTGDPVNNWGFWWQVDNVLIQGGDCSLIPGGIVAGFVLDANTDAPLIGAQVFSSTVSTHSIKLSDDLDHAGLYWVFQPTTTEPQAINFTTALASYASDAQVVNVVRDGVNRQDFQLGRGYLGFDSTGFEVTMTEGDSPIEKTLTITNTGALPVDFNLKTLNKPFPNVPAFGVAYPSENLVYIPDTATPNTWTIIGSVNDPIEDRDFIAGDFVVGDFSKLYMMDSYSDTLFSLNTTTAAYTEIGLATAEGDWSGLTGTPAGVLYGISTNCSSFTNLYTLNTDTAAATNKGALAGIRCGNDLAYNAVNGLIYIIDTYSYNLFKVDPSTLQVTEVGALEMNTKTFQGLDFEEQSGLLYWAANDFTSGQNELRTIDVATGSTEFVGVFPDGERVPVLAFATSGSQQWLNLTPDVVTLQPGSAVNVTITVDPSVLNRPGIYQAEIAILHDTDYDFPNIPFRLNFETVPDVPIISVVVTDITQPVALEIPDTYATISADPDQGITATTAAISWNPSDNPFGYNKIYTARVNVAANAGFTFNEETSATVNGETANVVLHPNGTLTISYVFPRTEPGEGGEYAIYLPLIQR